MRRAEALLTALSVTLASRIAVAQANPGDPQTGSSLPSGAAGAVIIPPKDQPPQAKAVLVAPVLVRDDGVSYPPRALADGVDREAKVRLALDLDAEGHVTDARVVDPQGHGFDEAAIDAARRLVFRPATRDAVPIPVKNVPFTYDFPVPASRLFGKVLGPAGPLAGATVIVHGPDGKERRTTAATDGTWTVDGLGKGTYHVTISAPGHVTHEADEVLSTGQVAESTDRLELQGAAAKAAEDAEDVYVRGKAPPRDVTVRTLTQEELSRIPGTNGDALKGLLNLPGVGRPPGIAGLLIVRGSAPQDTQVFVDGTSIPLVFHFGGLSSVVPTEMLDKYDFYPGNFSARYGRGMGGIVDVGLADPKGDKLHGLAQVDLIDARVLAEGPIADGWRFAVGGRRSWVDLWLKPVLEKAGAGVTAAPVYYDYQAILEKTWDKGRQDFRLALFGSDDRLAILITDVNARDPTLAGGISSHTGFWRGQVRYRNKLSDDTELRITAATGQDFFSLSVGALSVDITDWPISSRIELAQRLHKDATMNLGLDLLYEPFSLDIVAPPFPPPGRPPPGPILSQPPLHTVESGAGNRPGFYDELELTPWKGGRLVPGVRLDYAQDTRQWDVAPRVLVRQDLTTGFPRTTLKGAAGVYYQPPQFQETDKVFGQLGLRSNRATEYDLGLEQDITRYVDVSFDAYYKQLDHLVVAGSLNGGTGQAFGLETLLKWHPDGRFFGWLAYTLSRSLLQDGPGQPTYLSDYDQTHILTVLGSYRLGKGWQIGARFRLVSGDPYTPRAYGFLDENNGTYLARRAYPINGQRLPAFHQLDIRVDKTWNFQSWQFSTYLDVQNVYNQANVEGTSANYNYTQTSYSTGLPILPSFGLRAEF